MPTSVADMESCLMIFYAGLNIYGTMQATVTYASSFLIQKVPIEPFVVFFLAGASTSQSQTTFKNDARALASFFVRLGHL
jgi:hypothetical protein